MSTLSRTASPKLSGAMSCPSSKHDLDAPHRNAAEFTIVPAAGPFAAKARIVPLPQRRRIQPCPSTSLVPE